MKKILILTAGFGEGHNTAARSVEAAVNHIAPNGEATARVIDIFSETYGWMNDVARKSYVGIINRAPKIWQRVYEWLDHSDAIESHGALLFKACERLAHILDEEKPDVVVSTYPAYSFVLNRIYQDRPRPFPLVTVVTDSITINSVWYRAGSDCFIVPNEDTAKVLLERKVPAEKIKALGFPVTHRFSTAAVPKPRPSRGNRRVLFMINYGRDTAPLVVERLLNLEDIQLTVTVGRDEALRKSVEEVAAKAGRTVEIYGWTNKLPDLLMANHLLISKAGGATVQETIAAKTPMLIMQVVPGQEEGNAKLLLGHGCGALTETPAAIAQAVGNAFKDDARLWQEWEGNITKLSRPDASLVIARFLLELKGR
jgi:processive 1,2-diacylglycerol beta-glucosyltransferase